jgi:2'-5' RNA ligase
VGAFPDVRHPRVVWAGISEPGPMADLTVRVRREIASKGFRQDDKDLRVHLTLARVRSQRRIESVVKLLEDHERDELGSTRVVKVTLYRSVLGPRGPTYEALESAPLEA